jgi:competence protein ComEC
VSFPARLDIGPVLAAAAVVGGAIAGQSGGPSPGGGALAGGVVALAGALGARRLRGGGAARILGLVGLAALAAASMERALDGLEGPLARLALAGPDVIVSARLAEDPRPGVFTGVRVLASVRTIESGPGPPAAVDGTVAVVARAGTGARLRLLAAGESVVVAGRLSPLAGGERRLRWRHAAARLEATDLHAAGPVESPALRLANGVRALVLRGSGALPRTERALVAGLLVGDDRELPPAVAADFRAAGLSHLLAVSGANVALALALAGPALRRFDLGGRMVGGLAVVALFAAVTRFEPSVLRASAMAGLALVSVFLGRPATGVRLLALAVAGLVLADPFLVHSVGFALSCGATAGIVVLGRPLTARLPGPGWLRRPLALTLSAQLGAGPIALPVFGGLPLAALPANLAAAPAAAAVGLWGLAAGLAGGLGEAIWPGAADLLQAPSGALAGYLAAVASLAARFPATLGIRPAWALLAGGVLGLGLRRALGPPRRGAGTPSAPGAAADRRPGRPAP